MGKHFWSSTNEICSGNEKRAKNSNYQKFNPTLQLPHATVHSSLPSAEGFAWHSIHKSIIWLRHIAQLSTTMSQAQRATAFHFLISKRFDVTFPPLTVGISSTSIPAITSSPTTDYGIIRMLHKTVQCYKQTLKIHIKLTDLHFVCVLLF